LKPNSRNKLKRRSTTIEVSSAALKKNMKSCVKISKKRLKHKKIS